MQRAVDRARNLTLLTILFLSFTLFSEPLQAAEKAAGIVFEDRNGNASRDAGETGIPHTMMRDGAPNGYSILTCSGNSYSVEFRTARRPAEYQMNIFAPESVTTAEAETTTVIANVFGGSERSRVEFRLDGTGGWNEMEKTDRQDPYFVALAAAEESLETHGGHGLPEPDTSRHIWQAILAKEPAPGTHIIHVQTIDMFGYLYTGRRTIRIE